MEQKTLYRSGRNVNPIPTETLTPQIQELGTLTICALRYCFGRMSYMPSLIVDATKANWELLSQSDKVIILKDIEQTILEGRLGMDCDKQMWLFFYDWILLKNNENVEKVD